MSDVAAAAQKLAGAPEELVLRSATARAQAQGVSVDEVLAAWAGGASVGGAAPTAPEPAAPAEEPAAVPDPEPEPATAAPEAAVVASAPAPAVATILVEPEAEEEPIQPVAIGARIRAGVIVGAAAGAVLGLLALVLASPLAVDRTDVIGDPAQPAIATTTLAMILTVAAISGVFGAFVGVIARAVPQFADRDYSIRGRAVAGAWIGALTGAVLGFVGGGVLVSLGEEALDGGILLGVRSTLFAIIIGGAALGGVTGAVVQALASPPELDPEVAESRERISDAMMIPLIAGVAIIGVVVPLGSLLVTFHSYAPVIAILVAAGILTFAFLMSSRPNMAVTRGELLLAIAGVGIVLAVIALIAAQVSGDDGHGEESHSEEAAAVLFIT